MSINTIIESIDPPLLELKNITKKFPGVTALSHVNLTIRQNEIHLLLGENGAGKSTLIKTIIGINKPEEGEMLWMGKPIRIDNVKDAFDLGIAVVYQELNNIPCLSVVENIYLGNEKRKYRYFVDWKEEKRLAKKSLEYVGLENIDLDTPMEKIGMGQRQLVEIARLIEHEAKLIIMDEPTSSLSRSEIDNLLKIMVELNKMGVSILFITHKLDEAKKVGHIVTVLKDGKNSGQTIGINDLSEDDLISMMVGRKIEDKYPKRSVELGEEVFRCHNLSSKKFKGISFDLRRGELLGIFGLVGAGRTELVRAIFGADPLMEGEIFINGKEERINDPHAAISKGIVLITENRKEEGLTLIHSLVENTTISTLNKFKDGPVINNKKRNNAVFDFGNKVALRPLNPQLQALNFSGGNQQKIVIMKWLMTGAKIFIFDEPTKGVDIGAKVEIYTIMNQLLEQGSSIIMISSEIPEIIGMSDRIMTMYEGKQTGIVNNDENINEERILSISTGRD
ncbi:MAG: sugar ABC transporter ATP-binding protein [Treponema sp.]|nr:sugar ABC transporter ATP-binding protein [Treponema sp.]